MSGLIDWGLAGRIAHAAAGDSPPAPARGPLTEATAAAGDAVRNYTGLVPGGPVPEPEWVSRQEWAAVNLGSMRESLGPLEARLGDERGVPGPLGRGASGAFGLLAGAQLGALVGLASRTALGQLEFPAMVAEREPRLLFVDANLREAEGRLDGSREAILRWISLHEVTHAIHLASVPWLRPHLSELTRELLEGATVGVGATELLRAAGSLISRDPRRTLARLRRSDPITLLAPPHTRRLLGRTQATMTAIEGFAEHVMDAAAPTLGDEVGGLRRSMERRREQRPPLARILSWLLGMELKLRQYRDGKRFCDAVVERGGIEALNRAWEQPALLPEPAEIDEPDAWLERVVPPVTA